MSSPLSLCKTTFILMALVILARNGVLLVRADSTYVGGYCEPSSGNYTMLDVFYINLEEVVAGLLQDVSVNPFFSNITAGTGDDQVFGLYYCNGAMDASDCTTCVIEATQQIQNSCNTKEAILYYLECTLRYANRDIFSQVEISPYGSLYVNQNASDASTLSDVLTSTLTEVIKEAAFNTTSNPPAYAAALVDVSSTKSLAAAAQCTPDIVGAQCNDCLQAAFANITSCCTDKADATVLLPSCQLLYVIGDASTPPSTTPFTTPSTKSPSGKGKFGKDAGSAVTTSKANVAAGVLTAIGFLFFISLQI